MVCLKFFKITFYFARRLFFSEKNTSAENIILGPGRNVLNVALRGCLSAEFKTKGASVHAVICDGAFKACVKREIITEPDITKWAEKCASCKRENTNTLKRFGIPFSYIGDYVSTDRRLELKTIAKTLHWKDLDQLTHQGTEIGSNIKSSVLRYLKGQDFIDQQTLLEEYVYSGLMTTEAAQAALKKHQPNKTFMSHGVYVDWGPALRVFLNQNLPVTLWMASYLKAAFFFRTIQSSQDILPHRISNHKWNEISKTPICTAQENEIQTYFHERYVLNTCFDMSGYAPPQKKKQALLDLLGIDREIQRPIWCIFTHINWDNVADFAPMHFDTFNEWIRQTIDHIIHLPNVHWLIKVHPGETHENHGLTTYQIVCEKIKEHYPHITIIPPTTTINPLDLYDLIDGGVTALGTSGLELAAHGKPVILSGAAHYGQKGFTYDSASKQGYFELLQNAANIPLLTETQKKLAQLYNYYFIKKRQIYLSFLDQKDQKWWKFDFFKYQYLKAGKTQKLDFIVQCLVEGKEFILE